MSGLYRTMPGGMNGLSTATSRSSSPVVLEVMAQTGSRAQRRWAKRELTKINAAKEKECRGRV